MIQIYTGDGKGKTTAALGLALRAIGAGKKVAILQFMKKGNSSEFRAIKKYHLPIDHWHFGVGFFKILGDKKKVSEHKKICQEALSKSQEIIKSRKYSLIILDEINVAIDLGLIKIDKVLDVLQYAAGDGHKVDILLTGRNAHPKLKKIADLISHINKNKHYFDKGLQARKGIEY